MNQGEELFQRIYHEMRGKVWRYLLQKVPKKEDAEDISQQSWMALSNALNKPRMMDDPKAWFWGVVHKKIADFYAARKDEIQLPEIDKEQIMVPVVHQDLTEQNLYDWLKGFSDLECEIVIRKYVWGQTYPEMSVELGKSAKALEHMYARLLPLLKERYDKRRKP